MTKILIIDDDAKHLESMGDVVESFGYEIDLASSHEDALRLIANSRPDLVLSDYMFGPAQKTGLDALPDLRRLLPEDEVPIILMTAFGSLDVAISSLRHGLSDFLTKPIDPKYLRHSLEKHLEKARLLKENQRLFKEIEAKNAELAQLSEFKSKFLSFCAHDLANVISSTTMASDLLGMSLASSTDAGIRRLMELLRDSLTQAQRLIEDLVDWSAIEKGKFKIDRQPITLAQFLSAPVFTLLANKGKSKEIAISVDCRLPSVFSFTADSKRLLQVLGNLLENGLRHTPAGGKLTCVIDQMDDGEAVVFRVTDTGEGIAPEELPELFESFFQSKDPKKKRGRIGLGLAIAKEIAEGHGGKIWVESEGLGQGATFSFKIPL
ncbi:MAG: hybrid sensor histidine kinase/response regulator [Elusimicrobia bacterium]|nr:hybrid sensor histidine kinase/response regulator [Elusimicrobiota bacterium]